MGNLIDSRELPIKFSLFHWPRRNVPISEMISDKINGINLRLDLRVIGFLVSPVMQAARGRVVDMKTLGSLKNREDSVLSRQLTVSITQAILKRLKIFYTLTAIKHNDISPNKCYNTIHKTNVNYLPRMI